MGQLSCNVCTLTGSHKASHRCMINQIKSHDHNEITSCVQSQSVCSPKRQSHWGDIHKCFLSMTDPFTHCHHALSLLLFSNVFLIFEFCASPNGILPHFFAFVGLNVLKWTPPFLRDHCWLWLANC